MKQGIEIAGIRNVPIISTIHLEKFEMVTISFLTKAAKNHLQADPPAGLEQTESDEEFMQLQKITV